MSQETQSFPLVVGVPAEPDSRVDTGVTLSDDDFRAAKDSLSAVLREYGQLGYAILGANPTEETLAIYREYQRRMQLDFVAVELKTMHVDAILHALGSRFNDVLSRTPNERSLFVKNTVGVFIDGALAEKVDQIIAQAQPHASTTEECS